MLRSFFLHFLTAISLFAATALALQPGAARAKVFGAESFTLANGLTVVVVPNPRAPVVKHMIWYRVGGADEGAGESGIAHFLEHLMFKGTKQRPAGEFSRLVAKNGGRENAFTSYDYTAYHQTIAKDRLEMVMALEAERMTGLVITPDEVERERLVVLEERRTRTDNNPSSRLREQMAAVQFYNYPYRRPVIGWEHEIRALDRERILAFYRRWYAPNNAVLVVAGDITAAELKPLAEKYYGPIPAAAPVVRARPDEPPQTAAREVILRDPRVPQPSWSRSWLAPSLLWGAKEHAYALEVLAEILGGGGTSRLYQALVLDAGIADGAGAFYDSSTRGPSRFGFYASPRREVAPEKVEQAVEAEIAKILANGVDPDEVARAKTRMKAAALLARDSLDTGAQTLGAALALGLTVEDVESWPERIDAVTRDQVNAAARFVLAGSGHVTGRLLPAAKE
ncbi:MAG: insulinase family protein [Alphaproteobacteria bacterium]|nr:insulinase family protein [Alphaproteobacteria bacterium]MBM3952146.1 insulinase family protein [Rhodospirillales bacterium]